MAEELETNATPQAEPVPVAEPVKEVVEPAPVQEAEPVPVAEAPAVEAVVAPRPAAEPTIQEMLAAAKAKAEAAPQTDRAPKPESRPAGGANRPPRTDNPRRTDRPPGDRPARDPQQARGPRPEGAAAPNREGNRPLRDARPAGQSGPRPERGTGDRPQHGPDRGGDRGPDRGGDRGRFGDRRPDFNADIEIEKLISDSLYLDNQAHAVAARMQDMDSATKSHLRRFYNAVRRACRTIETERQHEFVMLRARLAYTIARHNLRSLDSLEKLLLQVTRKNDAKGYERFKDLFEAIIAYNE